MAVSGSAQASGAATVVDGVHRFPPTGIDVLVCGAGVGGMLTALECYRQGHTVRIVERTPELDTVGDSFGLLPSGLATIAHFPTMKAQFERESYDAVFSIWRFEGRKLLHLGEAEWNQNGNVHAAAGVRVPWIEARRNVSVMLQAQCFRLGIEIKYATQIVAYDETESKGIARTADGQELKADVVVAADGVGTKSHIHVAGQELKASSSRYACFRAVIPMDGLKEKLSRETVAEFLEEDRPEFRIYLARDMHTNVIVTPDYVCFMLTHPDDGGSAESWHANVPPARVIEIMDQQPGWDPRLLEMFEQTPEDACVDWKLIWRDPQPRWASAGGRVIQLGDSAHSFLPTSGNGATQAMEDAISLATCLRLGGRDQAHVSTKVHAKLRFERVSTLQHFGFANRQMMHHIDLDAAEKDSSLVDMKHGKWIWGHHPGNYAEQNFDAAYQHVVNSAPFESTNLPPGFTYKPWTIASVMEDEKKGQMTGVKDEGDWK